MRMLDKNKILKMTLDEANSLINKCFDIKYEELNGTVNKSIVNKSGCVFYDFSSVGGKINYFTFDINGDKFEILYADLIEMIEV